MPVMAHQLDGDRRGKGRHGINPARYSVSDRRRLSGPGLRTFLAIADLWGLDEVQRLLVLGLPPRSTYYKWVHTVREHGEVTLSLDTLLRISAVLGIHQALGTLFKTEHEGVEWLRGPHDAPVFGGHPPLDLIMSGTQDGLLTVRRFLDAARGGRYMPPNQLDREFEYYAEDDIVFS